MRFPPSPARDPELRIRSGPGADLLLLLFTFRSAEAITLGETVVLSARAAAALDADEEWAIRLLRHEAAHVAQVRRDRPLRFLLRYLRDYLRGRRAGLPHDEAYRAIPYEREAFACEIID